MKVDKQIKAEINVRGFSFKYPLQEEPLIAEMKTTRTFVFEVRFFLLTDVKELS